MGLWFQRFVFDFCMARTALLAQELGRTDGRHAYLLWLAQRRLGAQATHAGQGAALQIAGTLAARAGDHERGSALLAQSASRFEQAGMLLATAAVQARRAELRGDLRGREQALDAFRARGVRSVPAWLAMLAPGFTFD